MPLENPQTRLTQLYAIRNAMEAALASGQQEVAKYTLDGRSVEVRSMADLTGLYQLIARYESIVVAGTVPVLADFSEPTR